MPWRVQVFDDRSESDFGLGFSEELERHYGASSSRLFEHGHPVPPEAQPFRFKQHNTPKAGYPDLLTGRFGGNMIMSARMRSVIEGVASPKAGLQFVPVVIERRDGQSGPEGYSFFKVLDFVDAIIPERSEVTPMHSRRGFYGYSAWVGAKIAFRTEAVAGRHIWVDKYLDHDVYVSDELRAAMMSAGLAGVATTPVDPN